MTNREYRRRYYERIKEILREARKTISNEKRWCKGNMATVGHGVLCDIDDPAACGWCATGALMLATRKFQFGREVFPGAAAVMDGVAKQMGFAGAVELNDGAGTDHATVMLMFRDAIREVPDFGPIGFEVALP